MENKFCLSQRSVDFIKDYALIDLKISTPIDQEAFEQIFDYAIDCELNSVDENGDDKKGYDMESRDGEADAFITELSLHSDDYVDLLDLNSKLTNS
ncbi:MAG: hypothetical protein MJ238_06960 [Bacilli bacterium]|nr:hypothetical protein [Bacilli bacterium]